MVMRGCKQVALVCVLAVIAALLPGLVTGSVSAQDGERFDNPRLGIAFDLPAGWQVADDSNGLIAGLPGDVSAVQDGALPSGLVVRMVFGTFNQLGITDATQLPELLARLVASDVSAPNPERVQWGNASGYQEMVTLPEEGITTRVALLAIAGGRVAIVRGMAPVSVWEGGAGADFDALTATLEFDLPERDADYMANIAFNDGGVLWHYVAPQPGDGRVVNAGGITFDMFNVMYMAAGPGGVLALNMTTGEQISYMGPWAGGEFADIAIGPDTRLYLANVTLDTWQAVMVVDRAGNYARGWGVRGDGPGEFAPDMPRTIAVTRGGEVWTVSEGHSEGIAKRLYKFDAFGNLLLTVDIDTINPDLSGVHIDINTQTDALYMVGTAGGLNVVDSSGEALVVNLAQEVLNGLTPTEMAIAPNGNIIITLAEPGLDGFGILALSVAGQLLDVFGFPYDAQRGGPFLPGEYTRPGGLVIGPDGTGYWTETHAETGYTQVQRFTFTGDGLLPLGSESAAGQDTSAALLGSADPARGGGTLVYGQSVMGALNNRYPSHTWTFEGEGGDHVIITMVDASGAGLIDPKLALIDTNETTIAANDDVGALRPEGMLERDARIDFVLPRAGVYVIEAGRFGGRGEYILTLEKIE